MSQKILGETPALLLQSHIRDTSQPSPHPYPRNQKSPISQAHSLSMNSPLIRKASETKSYQQQSNSDRSQHNNSAFTCMGKNNFNQISHHSNYTDINRLKQEKDLQYRNFMFQLEFYIRQRLKDLVTIQELLLANQYQRLFVYVETELILLKKSHQSFLIEDEFCKPALTKDTFLKSGIEDDFDYNELIRNLTSHLSQNEKAINAVTPVMKRLSAEVNLSPRKLANYYQQFPFELTKPNAALGLATKTIELGFTQGRQISELISKSISQSSKGKYNLALQESALKSQMSKLIEQHSISKIKTKKSCF